MMDDRPMATTIIIEFRADLLGHFDVPGWNAFVNALFERRLLSACWSRWESPPLLVTMIDFRGLRRARYKLDGIDLRHCWLERADFTGASLRNSKMGCGRDASYRGARLHGADFRHVEISGCAFDDALGLESAMFDGAVYCPANPPKGLPPEVLARCKPEAEPPPLDRRQPTNPKEPTWFRQEPLRCNATIHVAPMEA
jgi:hypothetical protein